MKELIKICFTKHIEHGNIKPTNVFVEHSGSKNNFKIKLLVSDPSFINYSLTDENKNYI